MTIIDVDTFSARRILSLDPGGATGWCLGQYEPTKPLEILEHGTIEGGQDGFLEWWHSGGSMLGDEVVAEDFILDGRTPRPDLTPCFILGALEGLLYAGDVPLFRQRNIMKAHWTDEQMKAADLWWPGKGHDRDAQRHAMARMKLIRHLPTMQRYFRRSAAAA